MGQIQVQGSVIAGPPRGSSSCGERSILEVALALKGGAGAKPFQVCTGAITINLNTGTGVYQALPGVGAAPAVTAADTLYLFASAPMKVRLTMADSPDLVSVLEVDGLVLLEFDQLHTLKLLEASGTGQLEYFASGNA